MTPYWLVLHEGRVQQRSDTAMLFNIVGTTVTELRRDDPKPFALFANKREALVAIDADRVARSNVYVMRRNLADYTLVRGMLP